MKAMKIYGQVTEVDYPLTEEGRPQATEKIQSVQENPQIQCL